MYWTVKTGKTKSPFGESIKTDWEASDNWSDNLADHLADHLVDHLADNLADNPPHNPADNPADNPDDKQAFKMSLSDSSKSGIVIVFRIVNQTKIAGKVHFSFLF